MPVSKEKELNMRDKAFTSIMILCLMVVAAQAAPLNIVPVSAPQINCLFVTDPDCRIVVSDFADHFVLPATTGNAFLQSRRFPVGEAGTVAAGLFAYVYRLDLRQLAGVTALPCIQSFSVDFGPVVPVDYDHNKRLDHVFVVTEGGIGTIAPSAAEQTGDTITFHFKAPVCAGASIGRGDSTFFFGLAATNPSTTVVARVWDTLGTETELDVQVPLQAVDVNCDAGQSLPEALQKIQSGDTLRVAGTCKGEVTIPVDDVTLIGIDGAEIIGSDGKEAALTLVDRRNVVIKNMLVSHGHEGVLVRGGTGIVLEAIHAVENAGDGFHIAAASLVQIIDATASNNGLNGFMILHRAHVTFRGQTLSARNKDTGITIRDAAKAIFEPSRAADLPPPDPQKYQQKSMLQPFPERQNSMLMHDAEDNSAAAMTAALGTCLITVVGNGGHGILVSGGGYVYVGPACVLTSSNNGGDGIRFTEISSGDIYGAQAIVMSNTGCGLVVRDTSTVMLDGSRVQATWNSADGIQVEHANMLIDFAGSGTGSAICSMLNTGVGLATLDTALMACNSGIAMSLNPNGGIDVNVVDSLMLCAATGTNACAP
jgi:Right handed beta helix region